MNETHAKLTKNKSLILKSIRELQSQKGTLEDKNTFLELKRIFLENDQATQTRKSLSKFNRHLSDHYNRDDVHYLPHIYEFKKGLKKPINVQKNVTKKEVKEIEISRPEGINFANPSLDPFSNPHDEQKRILSPIFQSSPKKLNIRNKKKKNSIFHKTEESDKELAKKDKQIKRNFMAVEKIKNIDAEMAKKIKTQGSVHLNEDRMRNLQRQASQQIISKKKKKKIILVQKNTEQLGKVLEEKTHEQRKSFKIGPWRVSEEELFP